MPVYDMCEKTVNHVFASDPVVVDDDSDDEVETEAPPA